MMDIKDSLGVIPEDKLKSTREYVQQYISLRLATMGVEMQTDNIDESEQNFMRILKGLLSNYKERPFTTIISVLPMEEYKTF